MHVRTQRRSPEVSCIWRIGIRSYAVVARVRVWMSEITKGDGLKLGSDTQFDARQQSILNKIDNQMRILDGEGEV